MSKADTLDQQALQSAKRYMGEVAWPTIILGLSLGAGYLAILAGSLTGQLPLWAAVPLMASVTYLSYTVLHEAVHGSISGSHPSLRWINESLGYMAAWILMTPLTAHRHEHLAHHRHTNSAGEDPDFDVSKIRNAPVDAALAALNVARGQYTYYVRHRWSRAQGKQNLYFCLEIAAAVLPRLGLLVAGYWQEVVLLMGIAWLIGLAIVLYLFAYLVHRPHRDVGRYVDTSTILVPGRLHKLVTWLWVFQNYHSIHHLFSRVPFYHYVRLFDEIEPIMRAKGAPIYQLTVRGMVASSREPEAAAAG
ncbi:fatty acid desaturase [Halioglobus japonicus]|uniref:Fatty acid desaturase n=1 Tax=Halioglobus japonicus TaxID=930805 RepID=A0AAP8SNH1_9GAMM|nr:fatty acid desaturase [Halioglobus japonicus]AQA18500.1 fatty acid desaturase [Halioglobus japonicus]PLW86519.1 fatty acid desaturase [Halioglobus japonicus]GHD12448.1 hypothetical protein GCM10007052_13380 [Halioglobus japonicus]